MGCSQYSLQKYGVYGIFKWTGKFETIWLHSYDISQSMLQTAVISGDQVWSDKDQIDGGVEKLMRKDDSIYPRNLNMVMWKWLYPFRSIGICRQNELLEHLPPPIYSEKQSQEVVFDFLDVFRLPPDLS